MKNSTVSIRIEDNVKTEAEDILQKLGIPVSVLINSLYRQIIYTHGIPFPLNIPDVPPTLDTMSNTELNQKLQHSYEQSISGQGQDYNTVFDSIERNLSK